MKKWRKKKFFLSASSEHFHLNIYSLPALDIGKATKSAHEASAENNPSPLSPHSVYPPPPRRSNNIVIVYCLIWIRYSPPSSPFTATGDYRGNKKAIVMPACAEGLSSRAYYHDKSFLPRMRLKVLIEKDIQHVRRLFVCLRKGSELATASRPAKKWKIISRFFGINSDISDGNGINGSALLIPIRFSLSSFLHQPSDLRRRKIIGIKKVFPLSLTFCNLLHAFSMASFLVDL
jgi:hypothetical protein